MEQKSGCEHCKTWEEEMYWKHFNAMHFCQILPRNFHDHLVLPEKFAAHVTTQLSDKVSVTGPSGTVWDIELQKNDNLLFVGDGWKEFVKAYDLQANYLLMFKYKRNSSFEVLIFDQESFCEKEAAYFVKKCRHNKSEYENHKKRSIEREGSSIEAIEDDTSDDDSALVVSKKSKKDVEEEVGCLGHEKGTHSPISHTSNAAVKRRGRPRKKVVPCNSLSEPKAQSKHKSDRNEATQELSQTSLSDMNIPENGENSHEKDHSDQLRDQSEKNQSGNDVPQEPNLISGKDRSTPDNFSEMKRSHRLSALYGKEPSENGNAKIPSQISSRDLMTYDTIDSSPEADYSQKPRRKRGRPRNVSVPVVPISSTKRVSRSVPAGTKYTEEYMSNRREVTQMEKQNALQRAKQQQTENSFIVVMRPTCVYRRFYLSIPAEWMNAHLNLHHQEIVLRIDDKTWLTMFYYYEKRGVGGICPGWKKFVLENSLEEFDVLLFKLDNQKDNAKIVFDVEIFRVIPKILPPLLLTSSSMK
ncbi:B3 domain-containing protein REM16 isoform X2 [Beta vulgaris subsp. vulgaris]|uniref:B3 domain-containing protein REM16 isoform X2 n=1 Tax=Beta vulgaris subsp. vulgaris TaxID=3555 RepID=UPI00203709B1|nr:B3 domain-containing protein REM16 isoform X2 [Beta vulgaris subsp. vulgaris]